MLFLKKKYLVSNIYHKGLEQILQSVDSIFWFFLVRNKSTKNTFFAVSCKDPQDGRAL